MNFQFKTFAIVSFLLFFGIESSFSQKASNAEIAKHENVATQEDDNSLLKTYKWLNKIIKKDNCKGASVTVLKDMSNGVEFISVDRDGKKVMYDLSGEVYCTDSKEFECKEFYKLKKTDKEWLCKS